MKLKYLALASIAIPAAPALAQDATASASAGATNEIVVTGQGLPQTPATPAYDNTTLDQQQITSTGSGRLDDALQDVAGFQQFRRSDSRSSNPSAQGVTLRALGGNATSRAQVLLDGVPMADPFFGYIPLSAIPPERLRDIIITRGGGTGPFGAGAVAGAIQLESADARDLGLFTGEAMIDDRAETELSGTLAPQIGDGYAMVSGRWDRGKGFFTTPENQRVPATVRAKYDSWSTTARLVEPIGDDLTLQLRGLAFEDNRVLRFAGANTGSKGEDISARIVGRGPWKIDALAYGQWRNFNNRVISSNSYKLTLDQKDTPSEGQGGKIEVRPPVGGGHTLRLGADFRRSHGKLAEDAYSGATGLKTASHFAGGTNTDWGLFAEDDWELGPVTLTGGVRGDRYTIRNGYYRSVNAAGVTTIDNTFPNRSDWQVSWRGGAVFHATKALQLRAAVYTGLRLPTLNELYRPFVVFPVTTHANAALKPERLFGYEGGLDWQATPGVKFSLTAFDNRLKDAITNVTVDATNNMRENIPAIRAKGVELTGEAHLGRFGFDGSLAYTHAREHAPGADLDGFRPSQTPAWDESASVSYRPKDRMLFSATVRHVGRQFEDDQETYVLPAATTVDLFAQVPLFEKLSFVARAENLFDAKVVTRNQAGSEDLGTPQTFWAGFRYGF
ncbi:MAG TPA: TonB-dependent receptor [Croceibacterium sp.]|jgi:outer membrane receptor protein involved in Fe transport